MSRSKTVEDILTRRTRHDTADIPLRVLDNVHWLATRYYVPTIDNLLQYFALTVRLCPSVEDP